MKELGRPAEKGGLAQGSVNVTDQPTSQDDFLLDINGSGDVADIAMHCLQAGGRIAPVVRDPILTRFTKFTKKETRMRTAQLTILVVLVVLLFPSASFGTTITCSAGTNISIPETAEALGAFTCNLPAGFTFGANAGTAVIFDPGGVVPSDIITLADVPGSVSTVTFLSDPELPLTLPPVVNFSATEPNPFLAVALSTSGLTGLSFVFTSDVSESSPSENISVSAVPEPAALTLVGMGLFGVAARLRRKLRRSPASV